MAEPIAYEPSFLPETFHISAVYSIHYFKYNKGFSFEGEKHDFWELVYADAGEVNAVAGERVVALKTGQAVFHRPGEFHTVFTRNAFGYVAIVSFACDSPEMAFFSGRVLTLSDEEKAVLKRIVTEGAATYSDRLNELYLPKMHLRSDAPLGGEQMIAASIAQLLILLRRREASVKPANVRPLRLTTGDLDEQIKAILRENLYGTVTLEALENRLYFSRTALKRVFKQKTGKSIIQFFIDLKLEESKKLIAAGKYSFTQISEMLGFSSIYYFSRLFKQKNDMTPTQYARSIKTENLI